MCLSGNTKTVINLKKKKSSLPLKRDHKKTCRVQPLEALHNSLCNAACNVSSLFRRYRTHARLKRGCSLAKVSSQINFVLKGQHLVKANAAQGLLRLHSAHKAAQKKTGWAIEYFKLIYRYMHSLHSLSSGSQRWFVRYNHTLWDTKSKLQVLKEAQMEARFSKSTHPTFN